LPIPFLSLHNDEENTMKIRFGAALALLTLGLIFFPAHADDVEELRSTTRVFYDALNDGDVETARNYILTDGFTEFSSRGGALLHVDADLLTAMFDSGLKVDVSLQEMTAKVFGDSGYVTFHRIGTIDRGGSNKPQGKDARTSMLWIKQDGTWFLVHLHNSNLVP